jgi:hypothetical protein
MTQLKNGINVGLDQTSFRFLLHCPLFFGAPRKMNLLESKGPAAPDDHWSDHDEDCDSSGRSAKQKELFAAAAKEAEKTKKAPKNF